MARKKNPLGPTTEWANDQRMGEPNNHPLIEHTENNTKRLTFHLWRITPSTLLEPALQRGYSKTWEKFNARHVRASDSPSPGITPVFSRLYCVRCQDEAGSLVDFEPPDGWSPASFRIRQEPQAKPAEARARGQAKLPVRA